jgi:hypothetical protein
MTAAIAIRWKAFGFGFMSGPLGESPC